MHEVLKCLHQKMEVVFCPAGKDVQVVVKQFTNGRVHSITRHIDGMLPGVSRMDYEELISHEIAFARNKIATTPSEQAVLSEGGSEK